MDSDPISVANNLNITIPISYYDPDDEMNPDILYSLERYLVSKRLVGSLELEIREKFLESICSLS